MVATKAVVAMMKATSNRQARFRMFQPLNSIRTIARAGLLGALLGFAVLPPIARASEVEWKPVANMDRQLFPSLLIATATVRPPDKDDDEEPNPYLLGDRFGLLGVAISSPAPKARVKVTVKENDLMAASTWEGELPEANHQYFIAPKVNYKFDRLRKVTQPVPMNVTFVVEVNGKSAGEQSDTLSIRSINDCPFAVQESEETIETDTGEDKDRYANSNAASEEEEEEAGAESTDLGWMFAAYVNEDSPVVDRILKDALATGIVSSFAGYQGEPADVVREVFAIWKALQDRGIRYSSITSTAASSSVVASQHVRFIDQSIENQQANCVDGSVLFASVLRKLGIRPFLVTVPGHMYMGFHLAQEGDDFLALETTVLGTSGQDVDAKIFKAEAMQTLAEVRSAVDKKVLTSNAWKSFASAIATGTADLMKNAKKFEGGEDADYQITDIDAARADGIMPISYAKPD
jgi:hypothetical protein